LSTWKIIGNTLPIIVPQVQERRKAEAITRRSEMQGRVEVQHKVAGRRPTTRNTRKATKIYSSRK
jgi:hypothetical protein